MDSLLGMRIFVLAVERGSFAAAARECRITAPMVGKHIRALEERLGSRLLARTTRRQHLTEVGRRYYERCRRILQQVDDAELEAHAARDAPRGVVRISAPISFGSVRLAPALVEFLDRQPAVEIELLLEDGIVDLVGGGYDAAIRIGALPDSGLIARRLAPYRMAICAAPAYLKRRGIPRTPDDLADHHCLGFTRWDRRGGWLLGRKPASGQRLPASRFSSNNGQALRAAALAGAGILMQPEALLAEDLAAGRLTPLLAKYLRPPRPMHLVYLRDRTLTPKLRAFIEFVAQRFAR
jgi:DNA-binding transcriptional LysR family regulator